MIRRWIRQLKWLALAYWAISLIWISLELIFYGEIQTRIVDDIIAFLWIATLIRVCKIGYRRGWADGAKAAYQPPQICENNEYIEEDI